MKMRDVCITWFRAVLFGLALSAPADAEEALAGLQIGTGSALSIVMFHGDEGNGGDPTAMVAFGAEIARRWPDATVHMMLRPGYRDPWGRVSPGENYGRRDQYTLENAAIIAANLRALSEAAPVIAVGHSGGAAQLALALSLDEGSVEEAILVSCPCDLDLWQQMNPDWPEDTIVRSVSAMDVVAPQETRVTLLVGAQDAVTPPALSESYGAYLEQAGATVDLVVVPDGDHSGNRALSQAWLMAIFEARERVLE
jgi:pimeloyl-ACP methyl ester carboxylesterase